MIFGGIFLVIFCHGGPSTNNSVLELMESTRVLINAWRCPPPAAVCPPLILPSPPRPLTAEVFRLMQTGGAVFFFSPNGSRLPVWSGGAFRPAWVRRLNIKAVQISLHHRKWGPPPSFWGGFSVSVGMEAPVLGGGKNKKHDGFWSVRTQIRLSGCASVSLVTQNVI